MNRYFIESFKIDKLWGYLDMNLIFEPDVNILIGPNGSGKTTVLNLLHSILSADLPRLLNVKFDQAVIKLKEFEGKSVRTVKVEVADRLLKLSVGRTKFSLDIDSISSGGFSDLDMFATVSPDVEMISSAAPPDADVTSYQRGSYSHGTIIRPFARGRIIPKKLHHELTGLVPIVWLPVSRRLPVTEGRDERYTRTDSVESVDLRLRKLLERLSRYHSDLNAQISKRYENFGYQVLSEILYSKEHDQARSISLSVLNSLLTEDAKEQLLSAFETVGLLDEQMRIRIDEHFTVAKDTVKRIRDEPNVNFEEMLMVPLIRRTKAMVEYAKELEKDRERIFEPLRRYEAIVNLFLDGKSVKVDESGQLKIDSPSPSELNLFMLSSGEKQILILLTQALLKVDEPVVYIADEPELSLHVVWQEKLLESLVTLSGQIQIIVATHSPDIVGRYRDKVIDLGRES